MCLLCEKVFVSTLAKCSACDEPVGVCAVTTAIIAGSAAVFEADSTPAIAKRTVVRHELPLIAGHPRSFIAVRRRKLRRISGAEFHPTHYH